MSATCRKVRFVVRTTDETTFHDPLATCRVDGLPQSVDRCRNVINQVVRARVPASLRCSRLRSAEQSYTVPAKRGFRQAALDQALPAQV